MARGHFGQPFSEHLEPQPITGSPVANKGKVRLFHINIQSVRNKTNELEIFLADKNADIVCLSEHWLTQPEILSLNLAGFTYATASCRKNHRGGGSAVFLNSKHDFRVVDEINSLTVEKSIEICCIFLRKLKLYIISIYRSPSGSFETFLDSTERALNIVQGRGNILLVGDFNVHFGTEASECIDFCGLMISFGLVQLVNEPTRQDNCLDNVFSSLGDDDCEVNVCDAGLSDHLCQLVELLVPLNRGDPRVVKTTCRPITQLGKNAFFSSVEGLNWDFLYGREITAEARFVLFHSALAEAFLEAFPEKSYNKRNDQNRLINWFSDDLRSMREVLRLMQEYYSNSPTVGQKVLIKNYKKQYKSAINNAKRAANDNLINRASNPIKCMWNIINEHRNQPEKKNQEIKISPNEFNYFFVNIALDLQNKIGPSRLSALEFVTLAPTEVFTFQEVSIVEMRDILTKLVSKRSRDRFGFTVDIIKSIKHLIVGPLTKLVNGCLGDSVFPDILKRAVVVPVFKKGDPDDPSNYRPISLLPILSKVFEKCLAVRIVKHFESRGLFADSQFGFRESRSTTLGILDLVLRIQEAFEHHCYLSGTFCDLSKAFDCVSHEILLNKLQKYGFDNSSIAMISSYLSNRSQTVLVGGVESAEREVRVGVPQGSILGPLLFLIYINDLPQIDQTNSYTLFADDTTITCSNHDLTVAMEASRGAQEKAEQWFTANNLFLNIEKTQKIVFSTRQLPPGEENNSIKFLGVHLDTGLHWSAHTTSLKNKLGSAAFLLRRLSECVSQPTLKHAYYALCHSHISYAILAWGHSNGAMGVFSIQRRVIRIIAGLPYRADCRHAFVSLGIFTLPSLFIFESILFTKRHLNQHRRHEEVHSYDTRNKQKLVPSYRRIQRSRDGPNSLGITFFNRLPDSMRDLPLTLFKKRVKEFLVSQAFYSIEEFLSSVVSF